jgi:hypothetical protein
MSTWRGSVHRRVMRLPDDGTTLSEVLIVAVLLGVIGALVTSFAITTQRQTAATRVRLTDLDQARIGMDAVVKTVRTAVEPAQLQLACASCIGPASTSTALTSATATRIQLFANFGDPAGPVLVTYDVGYDNTAKLATLTETRQPPDAGSAPNVTYTTCTVGAPSCSIRDRTLVRGLVWPLPGTVFTYYDNTGAALVPEDGTALSSAQLITVDSIDVTLPVLSPNPYGTGATTVTQRVTLPNAGTGVLPTPSPGG